MYLYNLFFYIFISFYIFFFVLKETDENFETGFDYLMEAAEKSDKTSLYYVAKAFDIGIGLPKSKWVL